MIHNFSNFFKGFRTVWMSSRWPICHWKQNLRLFHSLVTSIAQRIENHLRRTSEHTNQYIDILYIYITFYTCIYYFSSKIWQCRNLYTHTHIYASKNHLIRNPGCNMLRTRKRRLVRTLLSNANNDIYIKRDYWFSHNFYFF